MTNRGIDNLYISQMKSLKRKSSYNSIAWKDVGKLCRAATMLTMQGGYILTQLKNYKITSAF